MIGLCCEEAHLYASVWEVIGLCCEEAHLYASVWELY